MTIGEGEFIRLAGKSGAGKSTLFKIINGIIPGLVPGEFRGMIDYSKFNALTVGGDNPCNVIATLFQNADLQLLHNYVFEECPPSASGKKMFHELLAGFGIYHLLERRIYSLSGGEKQKVAIASVFAMEPDILLLDEPAANLDEAGIKNLVDILKVSRTERKTAVLIAENRESGLSSLFDRTVHLSEGVLREEEMTLGDEPLCRLDFHQKLPQDVSSPLLEARNILFSYGNKIILDNISFEINAGEIVGLTGPNGCGKSTLAWILLGLKKPQAGMLFFGGKARTRNDGEVSLAMQNPLKQIFCDTVFEEISFAHRNFSCKSSGFLDSIMQALDLQKIQNEGVLALSFGELERTVVAASLSHQPRFVVLDEPTIGQDVKSMKGIQTLIAHMQERGAGFLIISHCHEFLNSVCNRIVTLKDGKLLYAEPNA